jgi:hypothetical protein
MNADATPPEPQPTPEGGARRYRIDEDGNVRGVVLTVKVDHLIEFMDKAIPLTPGTTKPRDTNEPTS